MSTIINRDILLKDLRTNVIEVIFQKLNGETRTLRCTLKPDMLPPTYFDEAAAEKEHHAKNPDIIAAWDVQNGGWRSFRIDSVTYVQQLDAY